MRSAPRGVRLHIGIFGRRNVGKSSLLNALTHQDVSLVSATAGTTTDPVEKPMELLPLGPVLFVDTAGVDDTGELGTLRVRRTHTVFDRVDLGILVAQAGEWGAYEEDLLLEFRERKIKVVVAFNKADLGEPEAGLLESLREREIPWLLTEAPAGRGLPELREALIRAAPEEFIDPPGILGDLVSPGDAVVLVVPIDQEAPRGRLILPQVQTIRDLLDHDCWCLVVRERELRVALDSLRKPPALVVTDSQAFLRVAADTPNDVRMTSFSILFSRYKGDLNEFVRGAAHIGSLRPGDRILVADACSHHPIGDDIARVKIPRWLTQMVGGRLEFTHTQGHDWPEDLSAYSLVVHCGACMMNRREMLSRILRCRTAGVPITNFGMAIAWSLGVFERALQPFPGALEAGKGN